MDLGLTGRTALVSGASRGIGAAIAVRLAAEGARVAMGFRQSSDAAAEVVTRIDKAGLHGLTRSLAREVGRQGVLVNAVLPGLTLTPSSRARFSAERIEASAASIPTGRPSTGEDIAALVAFLASTANGNISGELIRSAGGL